MSPTRPSAFPHPTNTEKAPAGPSFSGTVVSEALGKETTTGTVRRPFPRDFQAPSEMLTGIVPPAPVPNRFATTRSFIRVVSDFSTYCVRERTVYWRFFTLTAIVWARSFPLAVTRYANE